MHEFTKLIIYYSPREQEVKSESIEAVTLQIMSLLSLISPQSSL